MKIKISRLLLESIVNYENVVSKDETRLYLNVIHISNVLNEKIKLEATDSYIAIESIHDFEILSGDDDFKEFNLNREYIKMISNTFLKGNHDDIFHLDITDGLLIIADVEEKKKLEIVNSNFDYPNLDALKPKSFKAIETINFNFDSITRLGKAIFGTRKVPNGKNFKFDFNINEFGPSKIEAYHNGITHSALIMPIKM